METDLTAANGKKVKALEIFAYALQFFKEQALKVENASLSRFSVFITSINVSITFLTLLSFDLSCIWCKQSKAAVETLGGLCTLKELIVVLQWFPFAEGKLGSITVISSECLLTGINFFSCCFFVVLFLSLKMLIWKENLKVQELELSVSLSLHF